MTNEQVVALIEAVMLRTGVLEQHALESVIAHLTTKREEIKQKGPTGKLWLTGVNDSFVIHTIKEVRAFTGFGLKESKDLVEAVKGGEPRCLGSAPEFGVKGTVRNFEEVGATVEVR
jgi:ribosomal protein L7/L12